jgi:hypothetical protein
MTNQVQYNENRAVVCQIEQAFWNSVVQWFKAACDSDFSFAALDDIEDAMVLAVASAKRPISCTLSAHLSVPSCGKPLMTLA